MGISQLSRRHGSLRRMVALTGVSTVAAGLGQQRSGVSTIENVINGRGAEVNTNNRTSYPTSCP
ncbi:hypothetical protein ACOQFL_18580 [Actinopolyspora sp. H202]|uniref:hypothetical protein n=1 Tax=Actinopolyspora sp. H202 TaxID=1500456 RepID=UPI003EE74343